MSLLCLLAHKAGLKLFYGLFICFQFNPQRWLGLFVAVYHKLLSRCKKISQSYPFYVSRYIKISLQFFSRLVKLLSHILIDVQGSGWEYILVASL